MTIVTATEIQNNFGKYLQLVQNGDDIIIYRNGKEVARLISSDRANAFLTDSLIGVLKNDRDIDKARAERLGKYEDIN